MADYPKGVGYVGYVGWVDEDASGPRRFEAHIVFPKGPPDFPLKTVWDREPVTITAAPPVSQDSVKR